MEWLDCPHLQLLAGSVVLLISIFAVILISLCMKKNKSQTISVKILSTRSDSGVSDVYECSNQAIPRDDCNIIVNNIDRPSIRILLINHYTNELINLELYEKQSYYYNCLDSINKETRIESPNTFSLYIITPTMTYSWEEYTFNFISFSIFSSHIISHINRQFDVDNTVNVTIKSSLGIVLKAVINAFDTYSIETKYFVDYITLNIPRIVQKNANIVYYASINIYNDECMLLCHNSVSFTENCEFNIGSKDNMVVITSNNSDLIFQASNFTFGISTEDDISTTSSTGTITE